MGLDSSVKKLLRQNTKAFVYRNTLDDVYKLGFQSVIIDMNVELFRKPLTCTTGMQWARYIYNARIKKVPGELVVLLFDSAPRVPEVKDMCHLSRSSTKRKRGFIPLPKTTMFSDELVLPEWSRVTGSKHLLPKVWEFLIGALKRLMRDDPDLQKTVYFDTPLCTQLAVQDLNGKIQLGWSNKAADHLPEPPQHLYGEGDMKTYAWAVHVIDKFKHTKVLVLSTDLDNIPIFAKPKFKGVYMMGNTVGIRNGAVVPKKPGAPTAYELINIGQISNDVGKNWNFFVSLLTLTKTDFNENVHGLTTERILKTFFYFTKHTDKDLDGDKLLVDPVYYMKFVAMCNSKLCNNRAAKLKKVSKSKIMSFLARSQWVRDYWSGKDMHKGGPDCTKSEGWTTPSSGQNVSLAEYSGRVRLVPM